MFVSIGLFVRNGAPFVREVINSLLGQTYKNFELIISDNASTDDTQIICEEYVERDKRVRYIRQQENMGRLKNTDFVRREARGEYFMWACHDDLYDVRFIEKCLEKFKEDPNAIGVFSRYRCEEPTGMKDVDPKMSFPASKDLYGRLKSYIQFRTDGGKIDTFFALWKTNVLSDIVDERIRYSDLSWIFKQLFKGYLLQVPEVLFTRRETCRPLGYGYVYRKSLSKSKRFMLFFTDRLISAMGYFSRLHAKYILSSRALTRIQKTKLLIWECFAYLRGIWTGHY